MKNILIITLNVIIWSVVNGGGIQDYDLDPMLRTKANSELLRIVLNSDQAESWHAIPELVKRNDSKSINKIIVEGDERSFSRLNDFLRIMPRETPGLITSLSLGMERMMRTHPMNSSSYDGGRDAIIKANSECISEILKFGNKISNPWDDAEVYAFIATAKRIVELPENQHLQALTTKQEAHSDTANLLQYTSQNRKRTRTPEHALDGFHANMNQPLSLANMLTIAGLIFIGLIAFVVCRRGKRS